VSEIASKKSSNSNEIGHLTTLIYVKFKVLRNCKFIKNNNCYETSIFYKSEKNNNLNLIGESIESYKNKLLSSYWTEINLIGYKIELLEKQKLKYPKEELKNKIIEIENKISK